MATPSNPRGWQADRTQLSPAAVVLAGGSAVVLGSLLPFISVSDIGVGVTPPAKAMSMVFGLIVVALGITLRRVAQESARRIAGVATFVVSGLGALGYAGFIAAGMIGWPMQDSFGDSYTVTFSPDIGVLLSVAGCVAASLAAVRLLKHREA